MSFKMSFKYLLNHVPHKTFNAFCFHQILAINTMCYLNHLKQCKLSATRFLNYSNQNFNSTLGFTTLVQQNSNNAIYLLNYQVPSAHHIIYLGTFSSTLICHPVFIFFLKINIDNCQIQPFHKIHNH